MASNGGRGEQAFSALLQTRIEHAEAQRDALTLAISDMRAARSLTFADDEHDPEGSTVSLDQARDAALLRRVEESLRELRAAEARLADGSYGRCDSCGCDISPLRLRVRPEARLCVPCSTRAGR